MQAASGILKRLLPCFGQLYLRFFVKIGHLQYEVLKNDEYG